MVKTTAQREKTSLDYCTLRGVPYFEEHKRLVKAPLALCWDIKLDWEIAFKPHFETQDRSDLSERCGAGSLGPRGRHWQRALAKNENAVYRHCAVDLLPLTMAMASIYAEYLASGLSSVIQDDLDEEWRSQRLRKTQISCRS